MTVIKNQRIPDKYKTTTIWLSLLAVVVMVGVWELRVNYGKVCPGPAMDNGETQMYKMLYGNTLTLEYKYPNLKVITGFTGGGGWFQNFDVTSGVVDLGWAPDYSMEDLPRPENEVRGHGTVGPADAKQCLEVHVNGIRFYTSPLSIKSP